MVEDFRSRFTRWRSRDSGEYRPIIPFPETGYLIGVDLAQGGADWTALVAMDQTIPIGEMEPDYEITWMERWRDRRTARIPERVRAIYEALEARHEKRQSRMPDPSRPADIRIVVDQTGVGPFGLDPLRAVGFEPIGITIHGGDATTNPQADYFRVPKRDLAGVVHMLLEEGRIRVSKDLELAGILKAELENFRIKISTKGHDSYEAGDGSAWREGANDDLVLATAVAAWVGEKDRMIDLDPAIAGAWTDLP